MLGARGFQYSEKFHVASSSNYIINEFSKAASRENNLKRLRISNGQFWSLFMDWLTEYSTN